MILRRVVKLGGSLLKREDLLAQLPAWFSQVDQDSPEPVENLVIVGGGGLVEAVRELDRGRPGNTTAIHWLCVDLMETTMQLMHQWFPEWHFVASRQQFEKLESTGFATDFPHLVSVSCFYSPGTSSGLPNDWRTTSDAIAAELAIKVEADELVLLKSCDIDPANSVAELVAAGIVDQALPLIAAKVRGLRVEKL